MSRNVICGAIVLLMSQSSSAMLVLHYESNPYTNVEGPMTGTLGFVEDVDFVCGVAHFDNVGDSQATSVTLSSSIDGGVGFSLTAAGPIGTFNDWMAGVPTDWGVTVSGNVIGESEIEEIGIDSDLGHLAWIDLHPTTPVPTEVLGEASGPNTWHSTQTAACAAVPEPSSFLFLGLIGLATFGNRIAKRLQRTPQIA